MSDAAISELAPLVGVRAACKALGEPQARWYRRHRHSPPPPRPERVPAPQPRALSEVERKELRAVLNSEEHVDSSGRQRSTSPRPRARCACASLVPNGGSRGSGTSQRRRARSRLSPTSLSASASSGSCSRPRATTGGRSSTSSRPVGYASGSSTRRMASSSTEPRYRCDTIRSLPRDDRFRGEGHLSSPPDIANGASLPASSTQPPADPTRVDARRRPPSVERYGFTVTLLVVHCS